jgi:hypothetical protein
MLPEVVFTGHARTYAQPSRLDREAVAAIMVYHDMRRFDFRSSNAESVVLHLRCQI